MQETQIKKYQKIVDNFFVAERQKLEYAQSRWQDEYRYENPQEYKDYIKNIAKKHNLEICRIALSHKDYSVKITIKLDENVTGHIDIFENVVNTSIKYIDS